MSTKRKANDMANAAIAGSATGAVEETMPSSKLTLVRNHAEIMAACAAGQIDTVLALLEAAAADDGAADDGITKRDSYYESGKTTDNIDPRHLLAAHQDPSTGLSPLMVAARHGNLDICGVLLEAGAPWNAVDRFDKCAGDHATENSHWGVVNFLVEAGTKAELILGASIRLAKQLGRSNDNIGQTSGALFRPKSNSTHDGHEQESKKAVIAASSIAKTIPTSHESCTKPDYLQHTNVRYNASNTILLDDDDDAVMMEWERPLMNAHANILTHNGTEQKRVLNIGFGLGIIDTAFQSYDPTLHVIIEAHPTVYEKMVKDGWDKKKNVRICYGRWQDELPKLIEEGLEFDGVFYDTYGEHFTDLEDFHELMTKVLQKPEGIYSFFNGLAPDNLFFHGVACNCVKIQLSHLGLDAEFAQCEIQVNEEEWKDVRRKYWHGRETYYLPIVTWKKD
mmetsp:Transcript_31417/g.66931  ORF Transcript_31417/g.66931 Transcript_31417/m.66931 type:complete len:451 (+) Transcript_31417:2-1354(+)